jgi:hypothetical protein
MTNGSLEGNDPSVNVIDSSKLPSSRTSDSSASRTIPNKVKIEIEEDWSPRCYGECNWALSNCEHCPFLDDCQKMTEEWKAGTHA